MNEATKPTPASLQELVSALGGLGTGGFLTNWGEKWYIIVYIVNDGLYMVNINGYYMVNDGES